MKEVVGSIKMKEVVGSIVAVLTLIAIFIGVIFACIAGKKEADALYNNGICPTCGTKFHLVDVEHYRNGGNHYFYACENDHIIECKSQPSKIDE